MMIICNAITVVCLVATVCVLLLTWYGKPRCHVCHVRLNSGNDSGYLIFPHIELIEDGKVYSTVSMCKDCFASYVREMGAS